jgi:hypothetical protein
VVDENAIGLCVTLDDGVSVQLMEDVLDLLSPFLLKLLRYNRLRGIVQGPPATATINVEQEQARDLASFVSNQAKEA